jgi:hypothetical protein
MPPKEANKKTPPREANNSPPSEGSGVVSYRLAKRSNIQKTHSELSRNGNLQIVKLVPDKNTNEIKLQCIDRMITIKFEEKQQEK